MINIFEREKWELYVFCGGCFAFTQKKESVRILADATIDVWCLFQVDVLVYKTVRQFKAGHTRQLCDNLTVCFKGQTIVICHITAKCCVENTRFCLWGGNNVGILACHISLVARIHVATVKNCRTPSSAIHMYCMLSVASTPAVTVSDSDYFWDECYTVYIDTFLQIFFLRASPICIFASRCIYNI